MNHRYLQRYRLPESIRVTGCPVTLEAAVLLDDTKISRQVAQLKFRAEDARMITGVKVSIGTYDAQNMPCGTVLFEYRNLAAEQGQTFGTYTAVPIPEGNVNRIDVAVSVVTMADGTCWTPAGYSRGASPVQPAVSASAAVKVSKPEPREKPAAKTPDFSQPIFAKESIPAAPKTPGSKKRNVIVAAAIAVVAVIVAVVLLLPKEDGEGEGLAGKLTQAAGKEEQKKEVVVPVVTTPSDYDTVTLILEQEPDKEYCRMTYDMLHELVPQAQDFTSYDTWELGEDIDTYLSFSSHMMNMIYWEEEELYGGGWNSIWPNVSGYYTVLLFSDPTTLCGYFIGRPESLGDGKWQMTFNLCDYDFETLYRQRKADFEASGMMDLPFIKPDDVAACGAEYFYYGYGYKSVWQGYYTAQMYYLWSQISSSYRENYRKNIDTLEKWIPTEDNLFHRYFLLLDENEEIIGFTLYTPQWVKGPDNSGSTVWDGSIATAFGGGSGMEQDPYIINTAPQLAYLAQCANENGDGEGGYFRLEADLDLNQYEWTPIGGLEGSFHGYFDGNNHTISGLEITKGVCETYDDGWKEQRAGLFGQIYNSTITNLTVDGSISVTQLDPAFEGSVYAGGIVSNTGSDCVLYNCHNLCKITIENHSESNVETCVGGVVAGLYGGLMDLCSNSGEITVRTASHASVGGVAGSAHRIFNSWNTGSVTHEGLTEDANNGSCAGISGNGYNGIIVNSCNLGSVSGAGSVAGIVSNLYTSDDSEQNAMLINCYSTDDISYTGPNPKWNPIGVLTRNIWENVSVTDSFYPEGSRAIGSNSNEEGTVENLRAFDEVGLIEEAGEHLQDVLNRWVEANNQDDKYVRWAIDPKYHGNLPLPLRSRTY